MIDLFGPSATDVCATCGFGVVLIIVGLVALRILLGILAKWGD